MYKKISFVLKLTILALLMLGLYFIYQWWQRNLNQQRYEIEQTALKVEAIKNIAELACISFSEEVVVDSLEYFTKMEDQVAGNFVKMLSGDVKHGISCSAVKRRLTLITKGEVRIGFDLKKERIQFKKDSIVTIILPKAEILDVITKSSDIKIFEENGHWKDNEIKQLKIEGRNKIIAKMNQLNLFEQAQEKLSSLIIKLLPKTYKINLTFV